jgi:hypothetical protein
VLDEVLNQVYAIAFDQGRALKILDQEKSALARSTRGLISRVLGMTYPTEASVANLHVSMARLRNRPTERIEWQPQALEERFG